MPLDESQLRLVANEAARALGFESLTVTDVRNRPSTIPTL